MLARLRSFLATLLVKTPVRIVLGLVAFYFLFAWFGFEPLVKWAAPKYIADKSKHSLAIAGARFDPIALSVSVKGLKLAEPGGKPLLDFDELFVDFEAASLFKWAYTFDAIRLVAPRARVELLPDGRLNWSALIEALKDKEEEPEKPLPRLLIRRIVLEKGRVDVADRKVDFEAALNPLSLTLTHLSTLPEDKGAYTLAATTDVGARVRWKGELTLKPVRATGELAVDGLQLARAWPYLEAKLNMAPPEGVAALGFKYRVGWADKKLSLNVDDLGLTLEKLALRGDRDAPPAVALDRMALSGGRFDLGKRSLDIGEIALNGGRIDLARDAAGRLNVQDWFQSPSPSGGGVRGEGERTATVDAAAAREAPALSPGPSPRGGGEKRTQPWHVNLARFALDGLAVRLRDMGFATPLIGELGNVKVGFRAAAEAGAGAPQVKVEDFTVDLSGLRLLSEGRTAPLFVLGGISLEGGQLDLGERQARVARLGLLNGKLEAVRDPQGRIDLTEAFKPAAGSGKTEAKAGPKATSQPDGKAAAPAWKYRLDKLELAGFEITARDQGVSPAASLTLQQIQAGVSGASQDLKAALPVRLGFRVKEGGRFEAEGKVVPGRQSAEVKLHLADLALSPAEPYLRKFTNLAFADGRASSVGRVRYGDGKLDFSGGFRVDDLLLREASSGERFLAWKSVSTEDVVATQSSLDIGELRVERPGMKLVIFQDKSTSLAKAFQKETPTAPTTSEGEKKAPPAKPASPWDEEAAAAPAAPEPTKAARAEPPPAKVVAADAQSKPAEPAFRANIERVRVSQGEMDFADLSLALPFGTRIHEFKGNVNGISTRPGGHAQLELDGRVDEHGLARAVGQLDPFDPTGFMDIKVVFQNVEMTNLTPYTATFVGRRIQSGKLSLDLEYKLKQRQMLGENKIIMNKLTLGERVESPSAKNLPLDLAIAILEDSNGVIDLDLPVSGSLDDPKFSYSRIIWKAIGNIVVKLVTAPFRALGKLFGGGGEKLEKVAFEAGESGLTPPEKEKFKQIAQILSKRPGLALTVHGAWSAQIDRPAMKELQLRRAVAGKMGMKLAAEEDSGPLSTANAKVREGLEGLYAVRFGETEWKTLQAKWLKANPEKKQESAAGKMVSRLKNLFKPEEPLSAEELGRLKDADLHALLYQRLLDKESVDDAALIALGQRRGQAVVDALRAQGVPAERLKSGDVAPFAGEGREVPAKLELGVAKAR